MSVIEKDALDQVKADTERIIEDVAAVKTSVDNQQGNILEIKNAVYESNGYMFEIADIKVIDAKVTLENKGKTVTIADISGKGKLYGAVAVRTSPSINSLTGTNFSIEVDGETVLSFTWGSNYGYYPLYIPLSICFTKGDEVVAPFQSENENGSGFSIDGNYLLIFSKDFPVIKTSTSNLNYATRFPLSFKKSLKIKVSLPSGANGSTGASLANKIYYTLDE